MSNNYETDLLRPIMDKAAQLAGVSYDTADEKTRMALKVGLFRVLNITWFNFLKVVHSSMSHTNSAAKFALNTPVHVPPLYGFMH